RTANGTRFPQSRRLVKSMILSLGTPGGGTRMTRLLNLRGIAAAVLIVSVGHGGCGGRSDSAGTGTGGAAAGSGGDASDGSGGGPAATGGVTGMAGATGGHAMSGGASGAGMATGGNSDSGGRR